jgi:hypothetical protein
MTAKRPRRVKRPYIWPDRPAGVVNVARPTKYGNPYRSGNAAADVADYRAWLHDPAAQPIRLGRRLYMPLSATERDEIAGRDLACHCDPDKPCHGDVLLDWANAIGVVR